jgi:hypothetical protein
MAPERERRSLPPKIFSFHEEPIRSNTRREPITITNTGRGGPGVKGEREEIWLRLIISPFCNHLSSPFLLINWVTNFTSLLSSQELVCVNVV